MVVVVVAAAAAVVVFVVIIIVVVVIVSVKVAVILIGEGDDLCLGLVGTRGDYFYWKVTHLCSKRQQSAACEPAQGPGPH